MGPPFVRVVYPKLRGGYVFEHGAICFEALTPKVGLTEQNQRSMQFFQPEFFALAQSAVRRSGLTVLVSIS